MDNCEYYQELISAMLDGELAENDKNALEAHLAVCEECRTVQAAFAAVSGALAEELDEAPEAMHENIMSDIRRAEMVKRNSRRGRRAVFAAAACAALVIIGTAASGRLFRMGSAAPMMAAAPAAAPEAAAVTEEFAAEKMDDMAVFSAEAEPESTNRLYANTFAAGMAPEAPAEFSVSSTMANFADEYYDLTAADGTEIIALLRAEACEESFETDSYILTDLTIDGEVYSVMLYVSGEKLYSYDDDGNQYLASISLSEFENFVQTA